MSTMPPAAMATGIRMHSARIPQLIAGDEAPNSSMGPCSSGTTMVSGWADQVYSQAVYIRVVPSPPSMAPRTM